MEETTVRPKPMVEIGGWPILRHIMQLYASQGFNEFVVALGYKGESIKEYFLEEARRRTARVDWRIDLVNTGDKTMTGGRVRRMAPWLQDSTFMLTYGDGLANVDVSELLAFHRSHGRIATLTAVRPPERTTRLALDEDTVDGFEVAERGDGWINGGFFVFEPAIFDYLNDDGDSLENVALTRLASEGQLMAFKHDGFWQCMDTVAERDLLESLWRSGEAPWTKLPTPAFER
jgi:glucose-1-phosphate cytidylyltransferase